MSMTPEPVEGFSRDIRMLIIDDDVNVLAVLRDLFVLEEGLDITTMSSSLDAISKLSSEHFDLIITDLMMPKADGLAVLRAVREHSPDTMAVIVTGFASLESTLEAIHLGVYDYINKPFQIEEMRLLVRNASRLVRLEREIQYLHENLRRMQQINAEVLHELDGLRRQSLETGYLQRYKRQLPLT